MHYDGTITLGNLITGAVFLLTLIKMHLDNRERLVKIETKMDLMWKSFTAWMRRGTPPDRWPEGS